MKDKAKQYPLLPPCSCKKKCPDRVSEDQRREIHKTFWNLMQHERHLWIFNRIKKTENTKLKKNPVSGKNRKCLREYYIDVRHLGTDDTVDMVNVCQKFFLSTIGYANDHVILYTLEKPEFKHVQPSKTPQRTAATSSLLRKLVNHPLLPPCSCRRRCAEKISEEHREMFRVCYWSLGVCERRKWLVGCIQSTVPKRRSKLSGGGKRRSCSRQYFFRDARGQNIGVCQKFFLSTLGYTSDKIITSVADLAPVAAPDQEYGNQITLSTIQLMKRHIAENGRFFGSVRPLYDDFITRNDDSELKPSFECFEAVANVLNTHSGNEKSELLVSSQVINYEDNSCHSSKYYNFTDFSYPKFEDQFSSNFIDSALIGPFVSEFYELPHTSTVERPETEQEFEIETSSRMGSEHRVSVVRPVAKRAGNQSVTADNLLML